VPPAHLHRAGQPHRGALPAAAHGPHHHAAAVGRGATGSGSGWAQGLGFVALILASVNIFGGFLVTQRMLAMYRRREASGPKAGR